MVSTDEVNNRLLSGGCSLFWVGLAMGTMSFLLAKAAIPTSMQNVSDHDLMLANNLGFIFPPLLGFWVAVVRRSLVSAFSGIAVGVVIGCIYKAVSGYDFFSVMVIYPCALGGLASLVLGAGRASWLAGALSRFFKGLLAGFVLGFLYMVILNVVMGIVVLVGPGNKYQDMMWIAGTTAMAIAGGVYLPLFHWSLNLQSRERSKCDAH
jgi:hypothetical protein